MQNDLNKMVKLNATWDDLYEHIAKMSEDVRRGAENARPNLGRG